MPQRNRKGQFVKGGSRRKSSSGRRRPSVAIVRVGSASPAKRAAPRRRRRGAAGGSMTSTHALMGVGVAAAALNYIAAHDTAGIRTKAVDKLPGTKTFGAPAMLGLACLAVDRFAYKSKYLKLAGIAGVVLAASAIGEKGADFAWLGDAPQRKAMKKADAEDIYLGAADVDADDEFDAAHE